MNAEEARATLAAQASRTARFEAADDVITNAGTVAELRQAVDRIHQRYLALAAAMRTLNAGFTMALLLDQNRP